MNVMPYWVLGLIVLAAVLSIIFFIWLALKVGVRPIELPEKRAGRLGERFAYEVISEILREDDVLLTNITVTFDGKQAEFDDVIINSTGVYIIEVKNYSGELFGDEDDYEWIKNKMTPGGQFYQKTVKNPIKQVKRQVNILSQYLQNNGINAWIKGYVFFVEQNCPVQSEYVLATQRDIDEAVHRPGDEALNERTIDRIRGVLRARKVGS
ncbi:MAG: NERD domain-containing protein [Lachnospiraceae bacterium]|nr:NERD domain-containing protein [Lachnospiraceae bacterium]